MKHRFLMVATILLLGSLLPSSSAATNIQSMAYKDLDGQTQSFQQYDGQHLVVEAFSTECSHCQDYHPILVDVYGSYKNNITLLSISINNDDTANTVKNFEETYSSNWTMGLQSGTSLEDSYNLRGTPTTLMFSPAGDLQACLVGTQTADALSGHLDNYLQSSNYSFNVEDGACTPPTLAQRFFGSILFPITAGILVYVLIKLIGKYTRE